MGLGFLAPVFLAAAAAVALPVWLHLTHRARKEEVEFPSLMFLERIPYRATRRRRIRHPSLLALRALTLLFVVAAFARPWVDRASAGAVGEPPEEVVILLDRSHSMGYGERWEAALAAARDAVASLGPEDRASLVLFDAGVAVAVPPTADRARLLAALDTVRPGSRRTHYGPALQTAAGILEDSDLPRRSARLVSDMQRGGWTEDAGVRFPPGAELLPLPVAEDGERENLAVTAVDAERESAAGAERVSLVARIVNHGAADAVDLPVTLELDGREAGRVTVTVPARGAASAVLPPFTLAEPHTRVSVRIPPDRLPADDRRHLVLSPGAEVPVLIVDGSGRPDGSLFLARALEIGEEPAFRVEVKRSGALVAGDLEGRRLIVLLDAALPGGETGDRLREWVERGGGLLLAPGERGRPPAEGSGEMLPATFGPPVEPSGPRGAALAYLDYDHPVLEIFRAPRSGDLTAPRFFRVRPLREGEGEGARVLARFDDGAAALVEGRWGLGRVFLWGGTLDTHWSDLPLHPVFLPLVRRTAAHLASHRPDPMAYTAGSVAELTGEAALGGNGIETPYPERVAARPGGGEPLPLRVVDGAAVLPLEEAGFYLVRTPGEDGGRPYAVAVNVDPAESVFAPLDPAELAASVRSRSGDASRAAGTAALTPEDRERRQSLWWYLLALALLCLATEAFIGNRLSRAAAH